MELIHQHASVPPESRGHGGQWEKHEKEPMKISVNVYLILGIKYSEMVFGCEVLAHIQLSPSLVS